MTLFNNNALNEILSLELDSGNKISEESSWPPKCKKLVILENKFKKQYAEKSELLNYKLINDRHYWYSEYTTKNEEECLACRF